MSVIPSPSSRCARVWACIQRTPWQLAVVVSLSYLLLAAMWLSPLLGSMTQKIATHRGSFDWTDDLFLLEYMARGITHGHLSFDTRLLGAPSGVNLSWTALNYFWLALFFPITIWFGVIAAYNSIVLVSLATNGMAMYWSSRRWMRRRTSAFLAGVLFMFSPYVMAHTLIDHLDLISVWTVPVFFALLYDAMTERRYSLRKSGLIIGLILSIQAFTSEEVLALMIVGGAIAVCFWLVANHLDRAMLKSLLRLALWAAPLGMVGVLLVTIAQFAGGHVIHGALVNSTPFSANALDFILPGRWVIATLPYINGIMARINYDPHESAAVYIGVPVLIVMYAQFKRRHRSDRYLVGAIVVICIFMLGYQLAIGSHVFNISIMPMKLIAVIPMLRNLLPVRIGLLADVAVVILLCRYVDSLRWRRSDGKRWVLVAIVMLSWLPLLPSGVAPVVPPYFTHYASPRHGGRPIMLVVPFAQTGPTSVSEYWQARAHDRFAMPEGYYVSRPSRGMVLGLGPVPTKFTVDLFMMTLYGRFPYPYRSVTGVRQYLRSRDVSAVVLGPTAHQVGLLKALTYWLSQKPVRDQGVWIWRPKGF